MTKSMHNRNLGDKKKKTPKKIANTENNKITGKDNKIASIKNIAAKINSDNTFVAFIAEIIILSLTTFNVTTTLSIILGFPVYKNKLYWCIITGLIAIYMILWVEKKTSLASVVEVLKLSVFLALLFLLLSPLWNHFNPCKELSIQTMIEKFDSNKPNKSVFKKTNHGPIVIRDDNKVRITRYGRQEWIVEFFTDKETVVFKKLRAGQRLFFIGQGPLRIKNTLKNVFTNYNIKRPFRLLIDSPLIIKNKIGGKLKIVFI